MTSKEAQGLILAQVRLHEFKLPTNLGGPWLLAKRRRWWAWLAIPRGNRYLRRIGAGVEVLGERAWHDRERAVHRALNGLACPTKPGRWLWIPRWPGRALEEIAADRARPPADRRAALAAAAGALHRLHQIRLDGLTPLSHGDATLRNVVYDPATGRAAWFDFDIAHRPGLPAVERHADDLRALVASAVAAAADLAVPDLCRAIQAAYPDPAPWDHLVDRLRAGPVHHSVFHFAQARPLPRRWAEVAGCLNRP